MKHLIRFIMLFLLIAFTTTGYAESVKVFDSAGVPRGLHIADDDHVGIHVNYSNRIPADYYLYQTVATPVISITATIGDEAITVVSSTGVVADQVITFYEDVNMFQSLVTGTTATTISLASPIDFEFTSASLIEAGLWSMNVNGSVTPQIFSIKAPPSSAINIHTINFTMLDASDMDDGKFGGMPALTKGILYHFIDGITKNLAVIVNNIGFWEIGFITEYSSKAPAGQYGLKGRRNVPEINGTIVKINAGGASSFQIHIRDDLTDLDLFTSTINGNINQ